jgi:hypothetical protein
VTTPWPFGDLKPQHYGAILADPPWAFKTWGGKHVTAHRTAAELFARQTRPRWDSWGAETDKFPHVVEIAA